MILTPLPPLKKVSSSLFLLYVAGNDAFRRCVADCKMDYISEGLPRREKIAIKKQVIQQVYEEGLVFMEKKGDLWYRVTCTKTIDRKVSQALREKAPQIKAKVLKSGITSITTRSDEVISSVMGTQTRGSSISVVSFDESSTAVTDHCESDSSHCSDGSNTDDEAESSPVEWQLDGLDPIDLNSPFVFFEDLSLEFAEL